MRCFIAIDINDQVRNAAAVMQDQLKRQAGLSKGDVSWVNPEKMHLTLKFLGDVKDTAIAEICKIVKEVCDRRKTFELNIESVGSFGGKNARVLWIGTGKGSSALADLQSDIDKQLALANWPVEARQFSGHLTLCRVKKSGAGIKLARLINDYSDFKAVAVMVDAVCVYQSLLTSSGAIYTPLGRYELG